jgi:hypothetical protein
MRCYQSAAEVDAAADAVWAVLLDGAGYPGWDSGVEQVEGEIVDGNRIKVHAAVSPGRAFPVKVAIDRTGGSMAWSGGLPWGLFRGVRTFTVTPAGERRTSFRLQEEFTGPLLGLIGRSIPDLQPSFDQFAAGLKEQAERTAARP